MRLVKLIAIRTITEIVYNLFLTLLFLVGILAGVRYIRSL